MNFMMNNIKEMSHVFNCGIKKTLFSERLKLVVREITYERAT